MGDAGLVALTLRQEEVPEDSPGCRHFVLVKELEN